MDLIRNRYEMIEVAGEGGEGQVVRALDHQHGRPVALKIRPVASDTERADILSEARTLLALTPHAALPLVRDDFFEGDHYYLVTDWVAGMDLERLLREQGDPGLPVTSVLDYLTQAAAALDHLHDHDPPIVHRDVKPANMILTSKGRVVLVDFGIAARSDTSVKTKGTRGYLAPEVSRGEPPTPAGDIYALAATALTLLTGSPPEQGRPVWDGIAPAHAAALERALRTGLATDPSRRPRRASELVQRLESWIASDLPRGQVTFLLARVTGTEAMWEQCADTLPRALERMLAIASQVIERWRGHLVWGAQRENLVAVFDHASEAIACGLDMQRAIGAERWPTPAPLRVAMAVLSGEGEPGGGDYAGPAHVRARLACGLAAPAQVLVSGATAELIAGATPDGASMRDLGEHKLGDLERPERLLQLCHADLPDDFAPLRSARAPSSLPSEPTAFIGRESDLASVTDALRDNRLVTVAGAAGSGKTRLAIQAAITCAEQFGDGMWLVEIATLDDPSLVAARIAACVGAREQAGRTPLESLTEHLRDARALLVLDGCERVVDVCAEIVMTLARDCSSLTILVTSHEPLAVPGEQVLRLEALSLPQGDVQPEEAMQSDAVRLFVDRATQRKATFTLTDDNVDAVVDVCRRVDGVPLAVVLAAALVGVLTPQQIAEQLTDRFRVLVGGGRGAPARHQTLRAALDWSYELLTESERLLLARLGVFPGGYSFEAAQSVCEGGALDAFEVLNALGRLVDKSFVVVEERDGRNRYRLSQTIHQYAAQRLDEHGETTAVRARHAEFFGALSAEASQKLLGADPAMWMERLDVEHDNLRTAVETALNLERNDDAVAMVLNLREFWEVRGHLSVGARLFRGALDAIGSHPSRLNALKGFASLSLMRGDLESARSAYEEAAREATQPRAVGEVANDLGVVLLRQHDLGGASDAFAVALEAARSADNPSGLCDVLNNLAALHLERSELAEARARFSEALDIARRLKNRRDEASLMNNLGFVSARLGENDAAADWYEQSLRARQSLGDRSGTAQALTNLADLHLGSGDHDQAMDLAEEGLQIFRALEDEPSEADALLLIAQIHEGAGRMVLARDVAEAAQSRAQRCGAADVEGQARDLLGRVSP